MTDSPFPDATPQPSPQPGQPQGGTPPYPPAATPKRLVRSRQDRWLGGVCGGVAEYAGVDANLVRLVVVLGTVLGLGSLLLVYLIAWLVMPEA
jgi:phage shock protein C